jgi:putative NADH-flavin reductase
MIDSKAVLSKQEKEELSWTFISPRTTPRVK